MGDTCAYIFQHDAEANECVLWFYMESGWYREELTPPFYEAIKHEIPRRTLTEVFGELLEVE